MYSITNVSDFDAIRSSEYSAEINHKVYDVRIYTYVLFSAKSPNVLTQGS